MRQYFRNRFYFRGLSWLGLLNTVTAVLANRVIVVHRDSQSLRIVGWHIAKGTEFPPM